MGGFNRKKGTAVGELEEAIEFLIADIRELREKIRAVSQRLHDNQRAMIDFQNRIEKLEARNENN